MIKLYEFILNESNRKLNNYVIPDNKAMVVIDFYTLIKFYNQLDYKILNAHKSGYYGELKYLPTDEIDIDLENLNWLIKKITNYLKYELLNNVLFPAISHEIINITQNFFNFEEYEHVYKNLIFENNPKFIRECQLLFNLPNWDLVYGGKPWVNVCQAYLDLYHTNDNNLNKLIYQIDHVFDLQHNSGTIFDYKTNWHQYEYWLNQFLNFKSENDDYRNYIKICTPSIKFLILKLGKMIFGTSIENYDILNDLDIDYLKNLIDNNLTWQLYEKAKTYPNFLQPYSNNEQFAMLSKKALTILAENYPFDFRPWDQNTKWGKIAIEKMFQYIENNPQSFQYAISENGQSWNCNIPYEYDIMYYCFSKIENCAIDYALHFHKKYTSHGNENCKKLSYLALSKIVNNLDYLKIYTKMFNETWSDPYFKDLNQIAQQNLIKINMQNK